MELRRNRRVQRVSQSVRCQLISLTDSEGKAPPQPLGRVGRQDLGAGL
jgi:hypothetical protein